LGERQAFRWNEPILKCPGRFFPANQIGIDESGDLSACRIVYGKGNLQGMNMICYLHPVSHCILSVIFFLLQDCRADRRASILVGLLM
jgi:hypothetical protein